MNYFIRIIYMNKTKSKRRNKRKTNKKDKRMYGKGQVVSNFLNEPYESFSDISTISDSNGINNTNVISDTIPLNDVIPETFDIETGNPNKEDYSAIMFNENPNLRKHSMDSLNSFGSDPELNKIFDEINSDPKPRYREIYKGNYPVYTYNRPATTVIQRPFSPLSKNKERKRASSLPDYKNPYISGNRSLEDIEKGIVRNPSYLTFEERQRSPSLNIYLRKISEDSGPIKFGGKKKKNKTKKYRKCTRKSRKKHK